MRPSKKHFTDINSNFADVIEEIEFYIGILFWSKNPWILKTVILLTVTSHEKESVITGSFTLYITLIRFLTNFPNLMPPWKHQKNFGFLVLQGVWNKNFD